MAGELVEWDSDFWGVRVARVVDADSDEWARANDVDVAYLLVAGTDTAQAQRAEANGFRLMDVRVTVDAPAVPSAQPVRPHREADVEGLRRIARTSHRDSRFYADPRFPRERCDDLYDTWIRRSCEGWADVVLVAERDDLPAGYMTIHRGDGVATFGLLGVDEASRGRGIGQELVRGALAWSSDVGLSRCTLATQGSNVAAQRLFQRCGFRTSGLEFWFHKWFD